MALTVLAECRPILRACYFFIKNFSYSGQPSVDIDERTISIRTSDRELRIHLPPVLSLVPGEVPVQTSTSCITFRAWIKVFNQTTQLLSELPEFGPDFDISDSVSIRCSFCCHFLTDSVVFSRVLPLPSSDEPNDFFCHRNNEPLSLDPKPLDLFFNYFFYKVHIDRFVVSTKNDKFECPKCSELLGEVRGKCVKLWSSVVRFSSETGETTSVERFLKSFTYFIRNLPSQMNKFVFTCSDGSCSRYTLLWVMDRALIVFEAPQRDGNCPDDVYLEPRTMMKVLFSHHDQLTGTVDEWMKSFNTSVIPIHPKIEEKLLLYLKKTADKIPSADVDGMGVSYLGA